MTGQAPDPVEAVALKACPFCGKTLSEPTPVQYPQKGLARLHPGDVVDGDCPLSGWGFYDHQLAAWNTRTIPHTEAGSELTKRLHELEQARADFVTKRLAMNAAIPDVTNGTPAERALYDERYKADHEAERHLYRLALAFAQWATDTEAAAHIESLTTDLTRMSDAAEGMREVFKIMAGPPERDPELPPIYQPCWSAEQCRAMARQALKDHANVN